MFMNIDKKRSQAVAAIDESGTELTYGDLCDLSSFFHSLVSKKELLFILCENTLGSLCAYVAAQSNNVVPLLLSAEIDPGLCQALIERYSPAYLWLPQHLIQKLSFQDILWENLDYVLVNTGLKSPDLNEELALLLTTSGSTGSPKLVRQSYNNIRSNAQSICKYLEITDRERPITSLPMNYTYGLSIINSHMMAGATLLMTTKSIMQKEFWDFFKKYHATSFSGVPYHYEILNKLHFQSMELPSLVTMTQAGGKLALELHRSFAQYAEKTGRRFFVMYGQTEATARMGYLPYQRALDKCGSMGIAIPGGSFQLIDEDGQLIREADKDGELIYTGSNVMLGYAEKQDDLSKGDEQKGVLRTGDMAQRDEDGFYYITGRKKRFLKIFGNRVNLDACERLIKSEFQVECACTGEDDLLEIFVVNVRKDTEIVNFVSQKTGIYPKAFKVHVVEEIPKNASGKIQYRELQQWNKS